ncbi:hypothetical protein [Desulfovibrio sp. JC010]|uniref:hypothetical protein n=1 Tax=Desulfovibrio sp. JC010 TaxID=2593641 RepID=UPI0013D54C00|nr:hypothetical protein [Desulfovibrio sp. JC010]NDV28063.1 hypothetical protein [Desulfovibrio sp. JC010]
MSFKRRRSLLSPLVDLFMMLALLFLVLYLAADGRGQGGSFSFLEMKRGGTFAYNSDNIAIEAAPAIRQAFYNIVYSIKSDWRDLGVDRPRRYYRLIANSDSLEFPGSVRNSRLSLDRATSALVLGMMERATFNELVIYKYLEVLKTKLGKDYAGPQNLAEFRKKHYRWLYTNDYSTPKANGSCAFLLIWSDPGFTRDKDSLLLKIEKEQISYAYFAMDSKIGFDEEKPFYRLITYRSAYPECALDVDKAHRIVAAALGGLEFRPVKNSFIPLQEYIATHVRDSQAFPICRTNYPYLPFLQVSSRASYLSDPYVCTQSVQEISRKLKERMAKEKDSKRLELLGHALGYQDMSGNKRSYLTNKLFSSDTSNVDRFFEKNGQVVNYLLSNQKNREFMVKEVWYEVVNGKKINVIRDIVLGLEIMNNNPWAKNGTIFNRCMKSYRVVPTPLEKIPKNERQAFKKAWEKAQNCTSSKKVGAVHDRLTIYALMKDACREAVNNPDLFKTYRILFPESKKVKAKIISLTRWFL